MIDWFYYHGNDLSKLTKEEARVELRVQEILVHIFSREAGKMQTKVRDRKEALDKFEERTKAKGIYTKSHHDEAKVSYLEKVGCLEILNQLKSSAEGAVANLRDRTHPHPRNLRKNLSKDKREWDNRSRAARTELARAESIDKVWNRKAFNAIAEDRGYKVEEAMLNDMAKVLNTTPKYVTKLLNTGKFTWGQVLLIGAMFEMTPREFSETFMRGYFEEIAEGQFRAWADRDQLIYKALPKQEPAPEIIMVDGDGAPITEIDMGKFCGTDTGVIVDEI